MPLLVAWNMKSVPVVALHVKAHFCSRQNARICWFDSEWPGDLCGAGCRLQAWASRRKGSGLEARAPRFSLIRVISWDQAAVGLELVSAGGPTWLKEIT